MLMIVGGPPKIRSITERAKNERGWEMFLPETPLLDAVGVRRETLARDYQRQFEAGEDGVIANWFVLSCTDVETYASLEHRIRVWFLIPELVFRRSTLRGALTDETFSLAKLHRAISSVAFAATDDKQHLERYRPGPGEAGRNMWDRYDHVVLGYERREHTTGARQLHDSLQGAMRAINHLDRGGDQLMGLGLSGDAWLIDGEVMNRLVMNSPREGIANPDGTIWTREE